MTVDLLRALYAQATPATKWVMIPSDCNGDGQATVEAMHYIEGPIARCKGNDDNARLIAAMRNALPALLDVVEAATLVQQDFPCPHPPTRDPVCTPCYDEGTRREALLTAALRAFANIA